MTSIISVLVCKFTTRARPNRPLLAMLKNSVLNKLKTLVGSQNYQHLTINFITNNTGNFIIQPNINLIIYFHGIYLEMQAVFRVPG